MLVQSSPEPPPPHSTLGSSDHFIEGLVTEDSLVQFSPEPLPPNVKMPKVKSKPCKKLNDLVREFGTDIFSTDNCVLFCKVCEKAVNHEKKYFVVQHVQTAKHKSAAEKTSKDKSQACLLTTFTASSSRKAEFSSDLCKAFIDAGIPLWKLENQSLRCFLEKYTKEHIPSESTLRKNYVDTNYNTTVQSIRDSVADNKIWISIDETTDALGRFIANVVIGTLKPGEEPKEYLLTSEVLEKSNSTTIAQLFTNSLAILWPEEVKHENVLLFVTDAAPYMKKAGRALKVIFPNMLHVTCLAHGLHRVAEHIRSLYPTVDRLVSNVKKIFLKAPSRVLLFKEMAPEIPLPPQPVLTRWGTWLSAALYYAEHFEKIQEIVACLQDEDSAAVRIVSEIMKKSSLHRNLVYIASNFANIPQTITSLEKRGETLVNNMHVFKKATSCISEAPGDVGKDVKAKCERVVSGNKDLEQMKNIAKVLEGKIEADCIDLKIEDIMCFKYAPVTSVEVERTFSHLKYVLSDRRHNLTPDNLKKMLVIMSNQGKL